MGLWSLVSIFYQKLQGMIIWIFGILVCSFHEQTTTCLQSLQLLCQSIRTQGHGPRMICDWISLTWPYLSSTEVVRLSECIFSVSGQFCCWICITAILFWHQFCSTAFDFFTLSVPQQHSWRNLIYIYNYENDYDDDHDDNDVVDHNDNDEIMTMIK